MKRILKYVPPGQWLLILATATALIWIVLHQNHNIKVSWQFEFDNRDGRYAIEQIAVAGSFNDYDSRRHILHDPDNDHIWHTTLQLPIGKHAYRFVINNDRWLRDPGVQEYGGPYSNTIIYVDTIRYPKIEQIDPPNGAWLYHRPERACIRFNRSMAGVQPYHVLVRVDSQMVEYSVDDSLLVFRMPPLSDGEHHWSVEIQKRNGDVPNRKSGIWMVNRDNQSPQAHAGYTTFTAPGDTVRLNGGQSFDPDFEPLTRIRWQLLTHGGAKLLENKGTYFPRFVAKKPGRFQIQLTVEDSIGFNARDITEVIVLPEKRDSTVFVFDANEYKDNVKSVALVGEFNRWQPDGYRLKPDTNSSLWQIKIPLQKGKYEYKFVINDEDWIANPGVNERVADGWQGFNSIKTVRDRVEFEAGFALDKIEYGKPYVQIPFKVNRPQIYNLNWYSDVRNESDEIRYKEEVLYFNRNVPEGDYFYYLRLNKGNDYSKPYVLHIQHYDTTTVHDFAASPTWPDASVIYEIYLRRFTESATFESIIERLSYLDSLGVNTLWLMPVYEGPTHHGYAPTDLFDTEPDYGSLKKYKAFIDTAHSMGMRVIFDFVANHLSDQHRFVQAAADNLQSPLRSWFHWRSTSQWDFHNDWDTLVNLNYDQAMVRHYIMDSGKFWLSMGVDGFRCDVAWAVPHSFWKTFRREMKRINPQCLLINEVLPRSPAFHRLQFDMSYDTDFYGNVLDVAERKKPLTALPFGLQKTEYNYPEGSGDLRYLENHDVERFLKQFDAQKTRLMAALLLTVPGTPMIYYGQEMGLQEIRPPFYVNKDVSWFDFYSSLIKLRLRNEALMFGPLKTLAIDAEQRYWYFLREFNQQRIHIVFNFSSGLKKVKHYLNRPMVLLKEREEIEINNSHVVLPEESYIIIKEAGDVNE